jgi:dihydroxyacetone kinase
MLDALIPALDAFRSSAYANQTLADALASAAQAADAGARATADLLPRRGRSSYLGARALGHPDPGAVAVAVWVEALARASAP